MLSNKKHTRKKNRTFDLEPLLQMVQEALVHDLRTTEFCRRRAKVGRKIEDLRFFGLHPYAFKQYTQIRDFDKRVIWRNDESFESLSKKAFLDFEKSQETFCLPRPMSQRATLVISRAKAIVKEILGDFCYDDWFDSCSFGKRAAKGLPMRSSYLDKRLECLSGTETQWVAFNACLARDVHLLRAVRKRSRRRTLCDEIGVTAVPKSWKAARVIAPDTILGGFLSRGLGTMIRRRLEKNTKILLNKQQDRHRRWAQLASKFGHLSTIDLSKASDSFVWSHVEELMPSDWHPALRAVRTGKATINGRTIDLNSYMLMGSGHTFPLQTLLFYALAEATRTLLQNRGKVSVYGDDIIVPTRTSVPFIHVMEELGFRINSEKSFYDAPDPLRPHKTFFRESCGGDYMGGVDVRPYMPECDLQSAGRVPRNEYLAWCHKITNGLLTRWEPCELPTALRLLLSEVVRVGKAVCFVPHDEVDHAGLKHALPDSMLLGLPVSRIKHVNGRTSYWRLTHRKKLRLRQLDERPYVWYRYWLYQRPRVPSIYDESISLTGESRKDQDGSYRWKQL